MKKRILAIMLVAVMAVFSFTGCSGNENESSVTESSETQKSSASDTASPEDEKTTFTVGFDQDFPPMGFVGDDGEFTGFDLDLAKEAADRMGLELVLQPIAWDSKDMELEVGTIDCIWNGFTISGREDKYTWSEPYMENNQVFVVYSDSDLGKMETVTLEDFAGKTLVVQKDSSAEAALNENPDFVATLKEVITVSDYNKALMDLETGAVDVVAMDDVVASFQIEKRGGKYKVVGEPLAAEEYGVGFFLGNTELRDRVQKVLDEMAADGTMTKISEEWFGKDIVTLGK